MKKLLALFLICPMILACACDDDEDGTCEDIDNKEAREQCLDRRNPTEPTPIPIPVARTYTVEYRVIGTARRANIVYVSSVHGSTELTTGLPWFASFRTNRDNIFVSLYARAEGEGVVRTQILVDGELYREASTDGILGTGVEVSGTFIHPDTLSILKQR